MKDFKISLLITFIIVSSVLFAGYYVNATTLVERLSGRILLQVEEHGEAWYVDPVTRQREYMSNGFSAFSIMRSFGLGISNQDLAKIPVVDDVITLNKVSSVCYPDNLASSLKGRILLQVEESGEAWYVDPRRCRRIYMKSGEVAFSIMRFLGLGIKNSDLEKIPIYKKNESSNNVIKSLLPVTEKDNFLKYNISRDEFGKPLDPLIVRYSGTSDCQSNVNPQFTHHITDMSKVKMVIPPGTIQGGVLKTHSYLEVTKRVPVYAPVDSVLYTGQFYEQDGNSQYLLFFEVSCEVRYIFDHILEPIQSIVQAFPDIPSDDTKGNTLKNTIFFKAGQLIGYTFGTPQAHTWDFGVFNLSKPREPQKNKPYMASLRYDYADCPYDYFSSNMKQEYKIKYGTFHNLMPTEYCSDTL